MAQISAGVPKPGTGRLEPTAIKITGIFLEIMITHPHVGPVIFTALAANQLMAYRAGNHPSPAA
ncbi:MAG: hypothetical protein ACOVN0_13175 [Niveispirillum sp.]|uniref:hypothetical protein n=1 Tax=Niveispirillum sp. TaxID=1917217 RepID=UPI003BA5F90C